MVFPGYQSDPREYLHPQVLPGDGPNHVNSVFLSLNIISPYTEYVSLFIDVCVIGNPGDMCLESLLKVLFQLVLQLNGTFQLLIQGFYLVGLSLFLLFRLLLKTSPLSLCIEQVDSQFLLLRLQSEGGPVPERFRLLILHPIVDGGPQEPLLVLEVLQIIEPCIESLGLLVMNLSGDEICHYLVALGLHLGEEMLLLAFIY